MRVAFITARPLYPPDSGERIRTFHLLKQVSRVHDVTLVTATEGAEDRVALAALGEAIGGVAIKAVQIERRAAPQRRLVQAVRALCGPLPYTWAAYCDRRFRNHVRATLQEGAYDLVHCEKIHAAHAVRKFHTPPRLLSTHDVGGVLFRRVAEHTTPSWKRALINWQATKAIRVEANMHRWFDRSVVVSEADRAELDRISPGRMISVVPNGVDAEWFQSQGCAAASPTMVFVGSMDWLPNIDGVSFFVREVLPRIRRDIPDAKLWVVGRTPHPSLAKSWATAGVHVTGTVKDVRPFVAPAWLVVVPLRIGSGTRLKILEAWAMRKAVLSTRLGAEGLPVRDGENIALADEPGHIASRAITLLRNATEAARLGAAGRRVVEDQFTWPRVADRLLESYEMTVASSRRAGGRPTPRPVVA
jgi:polysaccharide biosynthesis protein PslH